jgi:hypothetical protein
MHHPRDSGALIAAPHRPEAVRRRRDVAVSYDDYFFDFSFIAVIFCWDVLRIRPLSSSPLYSSLTSVLMFRVVFSFAAIKCSLLLTSFLLQKPLRSTISARADSFTTGAHCPGKHHRRPRRMLSHFPPADHSHPAAVHFHHQAGTFQLGVRDPPTQAAGFETAFASPHFAPVAHITLYRSFLFFYPDISYRTFYICPYLARPYFACPYTMCTSTSSYIPLFLSFSCGLCLTAICRPLFCILPKLSALFARFYIRYPLLQSSTTISCIAE